VITPRAGDPARTRPARRHVLARAVLTSVASIALVFPAAVVLGGYAPWLPVVQRFGPFLTTDLPFVGLAALLPAVLVGAALALGGGRFTKLLGLAAFVVLVGTFAAGVLLMLTAAQQGASFSLARQLFAQATPREPDRRVAFASVGGEELEAEIWLPRADAPNQPPAGRAAVVYVHGGAFVGGQLGTRPEMFGSFTEDGIAVIDVEYRLAPPPRWRDAPADVLCALAWVGGEARSLGIDSSRVILMGESAGGSLALVAGLAAAGDDIEPSCAGTPVVPAGIVAVAPAADLEGIWSDRTLWFEGKPFPEAYIGGPPAQYPERYASASPFDAAGPGAPPTLIVAAGNDHLVFLPRVTRLADSLQTSGVETTLIVVPFAEHGFDGHPNGFGVQLLEQVVPMLFQGL
jgi:acetyl esterase/lipase